MSGSKWDLGKAQEHYGQRAFQALGAQKVEPVHDFRRSLGTSGCGVWQDVDMMRNVGLGSNQNYMKDPDMAAPKGALSQSHA